MAPIPWRGEHGSSLKLIFMRVVQSMNAHTKDSLEAYELVRKSLLVQVKFQGYDIPQKKTLKERFDSIVNDIDTLVNNPAANLSGLEGDYTELISITRKLSEQHNTSLVSKLKRRSKQTTRMPAYDIECL